MRTTDDPRPADTRNGSGNESSRKMLTLLLSFTEENHTQSVNDLAAYLGAPTSTVYRYVGLLREYGLLEEADRGRYQVSMRVTGLARAARAAAGGLAVIARPYLDQLARETGETALVVKRIGNSVVAVDIGESPQAVRLRFERGALMSLHQGAAARLLLAAMPPAQRQSYYRTIAKTTGETDLPTEDELGSIAAGDWTESFGQVEEGIWGCAAAIRDGGDVVAALAVAGPLYRLYDTRRQDIIGAVRRVATEINDDLSGRSAR
ncbi:MULTISPECIES: IclR family transcriptional regulator [Micromonospora]|uniref:Transcriptional regulator, IclR family n=1 Tax=Micromonospora yangpuensis TaxID=683228 RepID=A0A1C6UVV0_9ACTN|nr:IclR family transcriptional regulator C-terminal domain-containing protein [Micromonospora yangpuensis]GGM25822.1 transcriptional regulator [Micromonospora yangpuensis]SCL58128.1 transcriptional regulator, IclR family [Micromonospora yangpuensis]